MSFARCCLAWDWIVTHGSRRKKKRKTKKKENWDVNIKKGEMVSCSCATTFRCSFFSKSFVYFSFFFWSLTIHFATVFFLYFFHNCRILREVRLEGRRQWCQEKWSTSRVWSSSSAGTATSRPFALSSATRSSEQQSPVNDVCSRSTPRLLALR